MKESYYNHTLIHNGTNLMFNSRSGALAVTDESYTHLLEILGDIHDITEVPDNLQDCFNAAKRGIFIVKDDCDELQEIEVRRNVAKYDLTRLDLTIAPTLACNFKCKYCYETPQSGVMTEGIQYSLLKFIEEQASRIKYLHVTWYGGEPLLAKDVIKRLSDAIISLCNQYDIQYYASIVSNGYLLDEDTISLLECVSVKQIQITLDGPRDTHNSRRICKTTTNSFDTIINNINLLLKNDKIQPSIRINVDKSNSDTVEDLISYLSSNLINHKIKIYLGKIEAHTDACKSIVSECYNSEDFADIVLNYGDLLSKYGFNESNKIPYPRTRLNYCPAEVLNAFVIDPKGYMYKCWNEVGDIQVSVGNINNGFSEILNSKNAAYVNRSVLNDLECRECKVLPLCMGGCPQSNKHTNVGHSCDQVKYMIQGVMKKYLENSR
ncbi:MAG: SPASM domain-containing protein [Bacteroidales bacterium]|nr:SPASM domain-containing protein [Candidatus Physcocola equi]